MSRIRHQGMASRLDGRFSPLKKFNECQIMRFVFAFVILDKKQFEWNLNFSRFLNFRLNMRCQSQFTLHLLNGFHPSFFYFLNQRNLICSRFDAKVPSEKILIKQFCRYCVCLSFSLSVGRSVCLSVRAITRCLIILQDPEILWKYSYKYLLETHFVVLRNSRFTTLNPRFYFSPCLLTPYIY